MNHTFFAGLLGLASGVAAEAAAQAGSADTTRPRVLEPVVVTAERTSGTLSRSTAGVSRLDRADLSRVPRATLADLLRLAPGFTVVDFDGLGFDPQIMVRGFYGGGEAEYVVVLVDGVPVNRFETGVVAWDVLPPLASIEAIEIARGGGSSLYGDAAMGGVINVRTVGTVGTVGTGRVVGGASGGSYGTWRGDAEVVAPSDWRNARLGIGIDRTGGWREHAERTALRGRVGVPLIEGSGGSLRATASSHWRDYQEPGPLLEDQIDQDRQGSDPAFRFDHTADRAHGIDFTGALTRMAGGREVRASGSLGAALRRVDAIRTLLLAPGFGDTKERVATSRRVSAGMQLEGDSPIPGDDRVILGLEGTLGWLDSRYYLPDGGGGGGGGAGDTWERGTLDTHGSSGRIAGAAFGQYAIEAGNARFTAGARWDVLHDHFDPEQPAGSGHTTSHTSLSPRVGVNLRLGDQGAVYAAVSRSFKAPTLDQRYDQRNIPVPFPPFQIQTANPDLKPQHGTNLEIGWYQRASLSGVREALSMSVYQTAMTDEVDFDLNTFRYVNIGRSRHRGVEVGLRVEESRASLSTTYSLQAAISRSGDNAGKRLKAIPRHTLGLAASVTPLPQRSRLELAALVTYVAGMFLDDANSTPLPSYTRADLRATVQAAGGGLSLFGDIRNVFGARYSSTGYLDPSGSGEAFLFPAAGRVLEIGVRSAW